MRHNAAMTIADLPVLNGVDIKIDKPGQRILIHRVNVRQVRDAEEQYRGVLCDWSIPLT